MKTLKKYWALLPVVFIHLIQWNWDKIMIGKLPSIKVSVEGLEAGGMMGVFLLFFSVFILAAAEEFIFRGGGHWLMKKITKNDFIIVGIVSVVFGLMHIFKGSGEYQVIYAVFFGIYFGALRQGGMGLLKLSLLHFVVNISATLVEDGQMQFLADNPLLTTSIATLPVLLSGLHKLNQIKS